MKPRLSLPGLPLQQVVPYVSLRNLRVDPTGVAGPLGLTSAVPGVLHRSWDAPDQRQIDQTLDLERHREALPGHRAKHDQGPGVPQ